MFSHSSPEMNQDSKASAIGNFLNIRISNPMDWRPIDRFILLACLVILAPLSFGSTMWIANTQVPEWLNQPLVSVLTVLYIGHIAVMVGFILAALKLRRYTDDWPLFENVIVTLP